MKEAKTSVTRRFISHLYQHVADFQQTSLSCSVKSGAPVLRVRLVRWIDTLHWDTDRHTHTLNRELVVMCLLSFHSEDFRAIVYM